MTRGITALALAVAVALAGCQDPYANTGSGSEPPDARTPAAKPPAREADASVRSERDVARAFAMRWVNWDWRSAAKQERELAPLATAGLARTLRANAASARTDATVARDKPGSRGVVAAIELNTTGSVSAGLIVTHEETFTDGHADLGGRRYRIYLVTLKLENGRWGLSRWAPQP